MTADDFFRAANERWREAEFLYSADIENSEEPFHVLTMFLAVVAVETMYTAYFVKKNGQNRDFPIDHNLKQLLPETDLSKIKVINDANERIMAYWVHWSKDLRYLDYKYLNERVREKSIGEPINDIKEKTYISSEIIIREGKKMWEGEI